MNNDGQLLAESTQLTQYNAVNWIIIWIRTNHTGHSNNRFITPVYVKISNYLREVDNNNKTETNPLVLMLLNIFQMSIMWLVVFTPINCDITKT